MQHNTMQHAHVTVNGSKDSSAKITVQKLMHKSYSTKVNALGLG